MTRIAIAIVACVASMTSARAVHADGEVSLYKSKDVLVVGLFVPTGDGTDDKDPLRKMVEDAPPAKAAYVTCDPNKVAGKTSKKGWICYLGVKRDGNPARADLKSLVHFGQVDATFTSASVGGNLELTIAGPAADALAIWIDCVGGTKHGKGVFACDAPTDTASAVRVLVLDGGAVKAAKKK